MTLLHFLIQVAAAWGCGTLLLPLLDRRRVLRSLLTPPGLASLTLALGIGALAMIAFLGACAGVLPRTVAIVILTTFALLGIRRAIQALRTLEFPRDIAGHPEIAGSLLFLIGAGLLFFKCLNPSLMLDSFMYHLLVPKQWLVHGRVVEFPYDLCSNYNLLVEMWYYWGLALNSDDLVLPKLSQWLSAVAAAMILLDEGRRRYGPVAGWAVAILLITSHEVLEFATTEYIDVSQAWFFLCAIIVLSRSFAHPVGERMRLIVLSGIFWGFCIGAKTSGHLFAVLAGVPWLACLLIESRHALAQSPARRSVLILSATLFLSAFLVTSPWLLKNLVITGDPYYPYFNTVFPTKLEYRQAAIDFHATFMDYGVGGDSTAAWLARMAGKLRLYIANVWLIDQNRFVAAFCIGLLLRLLRKRFSIVDGYLVLACLFLLPVVFLSAFWRYVIGPAALLMLVGVGEITLALNRALIPRPRIAVTALIALTAFIMIPRYRAMLHHIHPASTANAISPHRAFLFASAQQGFLRNIPEGEWPPYLEEHLTPRDRLLLTSNRYIAVLPDVPILINPHMNSENIFRMILAERDTNADTLAARLAGYRVTHILTPEPFDTPELQRFRDKYLQTVSHSDELQLYRLIAEP